MQSGVNLNFSIVVFSFSIYDRTIPKHYTGVVVIVIVCMVVGFTTTRAISVYHHSSCEFVSHSWRGVLDTTVCETVCQVIPISSTNKTDRHDTGIMEILLKVALNTINQTNQTLQAQVILIEVSIFEWLRQNINQNWSVYFGCVSLLEYIACLHVL